MDYTNICFGCMEEKSAGLACPYCGYEEGSEPESVLHLTPGTILQEKFLLGCALGQGGFGITYLAWDMTLNIKLAIKEYLPQQLATRSAGQTMLNVYKSSLAEEFRYGLNKFLEEARTLARFNEHPTIITVRDYFEANNTAYLVMNYHEGVTLQNYLTSKGGKISVEQALSIFMPVLDALKDVHTAGILHRDVSPDNLLIDKNGRVILIDFGAARQAMGEKSKSLSVIMKAGYSPPEQYQSRGKQGPWTDIYAVAATMYRALTGQSPLEAIDRMAEDDLKFPSQLGVNIKPGLEQALLKALSVRSDKRFQSVNDFQIVLLASGQKAKVNRPEVDKIEDDQSEEKQFDPETFKKCPFCKKIIKSSSKVCYYCKMNLVEKGGPLQQEKQTRTQNGYEKITPKWIVATAAILFFIYAIIYIGNNYYPGISDTENMEAMKINLRGNTAGNLANGGFIAIQDNWIYYSDKNSDALYKSRIDGSEKIKLSDDRVDEINVVGDWVYYRNHSSSVWGSIYKIRTDGTMRTQINHEESDHITVVGDWIYYRNADDGFSLYKIKNDGTELTKLSEEEFHGLDIDGDWIYFASMEDGRKIYRIQTDGTGKTRISDNYAYGINVIDDWIYYTSDIWDQVNPSNIFKIRSDGTELIKINDDNSWSMNINEGWIYYSNGDDESSLYKIRTDGTGRTRLNNDKSTMIHVVGDYIYYDTLWSTDRYRIRTDGSDRQLVE
jgi:serine/threonine protein kinase